MNIDYSSSKLASRNPRYNVKINMDEDGPQPKLIDASSIYYLDGALKKSHEIRIKYHRIIWNYGLLFVFIFIVSAVLYYRYTNKPTPKEADYKLIKDQEYVLSKIRFFQEQNQRINESNRLAAGSEISGLPVVHPPSDYSSDPYSI